MAKPKGLDMVGWSNVKSMWTNNISVIVEKDVNQRRRKKAGQAETNSRGHIVRQLGVAKHDHPATAYRSEYPATYYIYTHSQVSNGNPRLYHPPAYVALNREDMEWLVAVFLRELYGEAPAAE